MSSYRAVRANVLPTFSDLVFLFVGYEWWYSSQKNLERSVLRNTLFCNKVQKFCDET